MMLWFLRLFPLFRKVSNLAEQREIIARDCRNIRIEVDAVVVDRNKWRSSYESARDSLQVSIDRYKEMDSEATTLRSALADAHAENLRLSDRLETALTDKDRLWHLFTKSIDSERQSLRMQVNKEYKEKFGTTPYPEEWSPPDSVSRDPNATREPMGRSFSLPSQRQAQQAQSNVKAWVEEVAGKVL